MAFTRGNLTASEQMLLEALEAGAVFGPETQGSTARPVIRSEVIRNALRGVYQNLTPDPRGVRLENVRIEGRLDLDHLQTEIPLTLDRCSLSGGLTAERARLSVLRVQRMTIDRPSAEEAVLNVRHLHLMVLDLAGTTLRNVEGTALFADGLTTGSHAFFTEGFTAVGHDSQGTVRLLGASIGGQLNLRGAELTNEAGPALFADGVSVGSSAFLDDKFTAIGHGALGTVRLFGATIGGLLSMSGAKVTNNAGPALVATELTAESSASLAQGFTAIGHGSQGTVQLGVSMIGGQLVLSGAAVTNNSGPALVADGLTVKADVFFNEGFTAIGHGDLGTVRLVGASIGGQLNLDGDFSRGLLRRHPTLVLAGTNVGSRFWVSSGTLERESQSGRWIIDDLTYQALEADPDQWLELLRNGTWYYSSQPYQQFAAVARARGDERLTQKILIAQHNHQLAGGHNEYGLLTRKQRVALWTLRFVVGYGYQTWRALGLLTVLVSVSVGATFAAGWGKTAFFRQPDDSTAGVPAGPCQNVDLLTQGLGIIPLIPIGSTSNCAFADTWMGIAFLLLTIGFKIIAWALVTLFVAGYTNIVRKPGP